MASETNRSGLFLPERVTIDSGYINDMEQYSPEMMKQFIVMLEYLMSNMNYTINRKDSGFYFLQEFVTGQLFFPNPALSSTTAQRAVTRPVFRTIVVIPPLANAGTVSAAHSITVDGNTTFVKIYGTANDVMTPLYIPLPFVSVSGTVAAGNIEVTVDATNVNVTTTGNGTNFTINYVVLEYLKQ